MELRKVVAPQYLQADVSEKTRILDGFIDSTGYSRKHAISLLNGRQIGAPGASGRKPKLSAEAVTVLILCWQVANRVCAKRLTPFLPTVLEEMNKAGQTKVSPKVERELLSVSAATIERALRAERRRQARSPSTTKRSSLLRSKVPIRTFTEWNDVVPGFFELDTVAHCASSPAGKYLSTLNMTDIATCWTEPIAVMRKGGVEIIAAIKKVEEVLPFPILGLDCDNGGEFLNQGMIDWCEQREITLTRSREYKKNDQAWVEEKNRSVVRKNVGRDRFEGQKTWKVMTRLYAVMRLYVNFFQPCQKLLYKHRKGAKVYKKHDLAKTPYQRVLENENVPETLKEALRKQREELSMVSLKDEMSRLQEELQRLAVGVPDPMIAAMASQRMATYKFTETERQQPAKKKRSGKSLLQDMRRTVRKLPPGTVVAAKDLSSIAAQGTLYNYLKRLERSGDLVNIGWGQYQVPEPNQTPASH